PALRPPAECCSGKAHASRAGRRRRRCSSNLQVGLLNGIQHALVEGPDHDVLSATIETEIAEVVRGAVLEGAMGRLDAFPAVRRGKDLRVRRACCFGDGQPDVFQDRVVKAVLDLVNQYPAPRGGCYGEQDLQETPYF